MTYPIVSFYREGSTVQAEIERLPVPGNGPCDFIFSLDVHDSIYAGMLADHLCKQMSEAMRKAKQAAYEQGWKDKAAKRSKRTHFCGDLDPVQL